MKCTRMLQKNGWWVRCDLPAKWMVTQEGKEVPRCGRHALTAIHKRPVKS